MKYIVFESIDKCRKTTFIQYFYDYLKNKNFELLTKLKIKPKNIKIRNFPNDKTKRIMNNLLKYETKYKYLLKDFTNKVEILDFLKSNEKSNDFYLFDRFFYSTNYTKNQIKSKTYNKVNNIIFKNFKYKKPILIIFFYKTEKEILNQIKEIKKQKEIYKSNKEFKNYFEYQIKKLYFLIKVQNSYDKNFKNKKNIIKLKYNLSNEEKTKIITNKLLSIKL